MARLRRMLEEVCGGITTRSVEVCRCIGHAVWRDGQWSPGRRGPAGGVCGACGGAIPTEREQERVDGK